MLQQKQRHRDNKPTMSSDHTQWNTEIHIVSQSTTTERHLPYGIAQCYMAHDTDEHALP